MRKTLKALLAGAAVAISVVVILFLLANLTVFVKGRGFSASASNVKAKPAAIVFGALVYDDGTLSAMLADRVDTAIDLYHEGKVKKLLLTGDHGRIGYDEVNAMKKRALLKGVVESYIFTDHAGFSTYESLYRARDVFKIKKAVLVTQKFHLRRALYIARSLKLDVQGIEADRQDYMVSNARSTFREYFANLKAFWQVNTGARPTFLGPAIPITGDGRASRG